VRGAPLCEPAHVVGAGELAGGEQLVQGDHEGRRLAQASRVQRAARTWGEIWHVDGLAMALRDEAFRLRAEDDFSRVDWLYGNSAA
jgi:hypothetical protein